MQDLVLCEKQLLTLCTVLQIMSLYGNIRVREKPYYGIFYTVAILKTLSNKYAVKAISSKFSLNFWNCFFFQRDFANSQMYLSPCQIYMMNLFYKNSKVVQLLTDFKLFSQKRPSQVFDMFLASHCVKSVQIRSFFWSECGKIRPRKTPYLDTFHVVTNTLENVILLYKFIVQKTNRHNMCSFCLAGTEVHIWYTSYTTKASLH